MPSFYFTSTHDMAVQLHSLARRLEEVPNTNIPRTEVELDVHVHSHGAKISEVFDAVDHVTAILTNGQTEAELKVDNESCLYGTRRAAVAGKASPDGISVAVVNVEPLGVAA